MTNTLKGFIEINIELIDNNNWRQLFINAYDNALMTAEVLDLHNILLEADIFDSTNVRNELLFDHIKESNLDITDILRYTLQLKKIIFNVPFQIKTLQGR